MLSNWLWTPDWVHEDKKKPRIVHFRKNFFLREEPEEAEAEISADTRYKLYVNGSLVETGPSRGDREVWFADRVELRPYLQRGKNVVAVRVLRYPVEREAGNHGMFRTELPGLYLKGRVRSLSGEQVSLDADESWSCYIDRVTEFPPEEKGFAPLMIHERTAGDPHLQGWTEAVFDDSSWSRAMPYPESAVDKAVSPGNLNPRTIPFLYRKQRRFLRVLGGSQGEGERSLLQLLNGERPLTVPPHTAVQAVLDAGEEMTGYIRLALRAGAGANVRLCYAECYVQSEVSPTSGAPIKKQRLDQEKGHLEGYADIYKVGGFGTVQRPERYEPYWFRTFRLVELTVETGAEPLTIEELDYEETGYPLQVRSHVKTSDPSLGEIWDMHERTLRRCMHESYEDCPFYEQLQYVMDTRAQILYTYAVAADDRLARKAIDDFARAQRSNGLLNCSYPNMNPNVIPGFSLYYILMIYDHMMYFGDPDLARRYLPVIDRILNYFDRHQTEDGLVAKVGGVNGKARYWSFIDWAAEWNPTQGVPPCERLGPLTMESLLYVYGLQKATEICRFVGRGDTAREYRERAEAVQKAIRRHCLREDGMITDGPGVPDASQHGQVFGILTGTLDPAEGKRNLLRTMREEGYPQCTVAMRFYLFRALEECGMYAATESYWDTWREMLRLGCTTSIESEDYARSECHAWGALALYELPCSILGVRPAEPGFQKIEVRPHTGYLEYASGTVITPVGEVQVSWKKTEQGVQIKVHAPEGTQVRTIPQP